MAYRLPPKMRRLPPYLCAPENGIGPRTITQCRYHRRLRFMVFVRRGGNVKRLKNQRRKVRPKLPLQPRRFYALFDRIPF